ncbi:protein KIBRA-like isoform X2 [Mercenaria mercenaria]|uniref:protein KIBRA-like isoform X2 n=1 Tax=Mercenaria mercenaria TaxID=6596 RepID=UPI00234F34C0|nr:protein KIBRA-like isoform X2 [Mercenaria mercenaria]
MPRRKNGEIPLPEGWEEGRDFDGKVFYINHTTQQTTWIDPRDRYTKPQTFSDCVGDELPYGWEEVYDPQIGVYYVDHTNQTNQLEDPRQQWRKEQEVMLKDYLVTAKDDLEAKKEIYTVKEQRLQLAQDEYQYLHDTLTGWKSSRTSLNSNSSVGSTKYDPDLLKADVNLARKRVDRLRHELAQIHAEMQYKQKGLDTLAMVDQKLSGQGAGYSIDEAREIMDEMRTIQTSLHSGERERLELMKALARLKEDFLRTKIGGSSPDVSTLSLSLEKSTTASQTDLRGEFGLTSSRYLAEITRLRLQYDEAKHRLSQLKHMLADLEDDMVPGQNESDKDRLLLVQEKEQLLRELRSIDPKGRSPEEIENVNLRIQQLGIDLNHAKEISNKQIAERLKHQERKTEILKDLAETTKKTTMLESQLKSMSMSTLSISSGSSLGSLGSLGSLSESSRGSLSSLSLTDLYGAPSSSSTNLQELHRRVEKLLQGHSSSISPIHENPVVSVAPDIMAAATGGYLQSVLGHSNQDLTSGLTSNVPSASVSVNIPSSLVTASPHSSLTSLSPPVSPYDISPFPTYEAGPPPTYTQHMNINVPNISKPPPPYVPQGRMAPTPPFSSSVNNANITPFVPQVNSNQSKVALEASFMPTHSKSDSSSIGGQMSFNTNSGYSVVHSHGLETSVNSDQVLNSNISKRIQYPENLDVASNPPLSPISESSSGVGNNLSGGNTRSVSAAVSDESVAGDSGVFEAVVKRDHMLDEVLEMGMESAQIQIKLKYETLESLLNVGIEQARNLAALQFPESSKVCIKAALLPNPDMSWVTEPSSDLKNPKFSELFRISIPQRILFTKTLQVNIWCLQDNRPDECFGCASVSLADFDPKDVISIRWYNVLSFKFMQPDTNSIQSNTSVPSKKSSSSSADTMGENVTITYSQTETVRQTETTQFESSVSSDKVTRLLEASSARLRDREKESHYRVHPVVSSLKEESSDESTIISSQTSTLTRNQGPDEMSDHADDTLKLGNEFGMGDPDEDEIEDDDDMDYTGLNMVEDVIRGFEKTLEGICSSEGSTDQDDPLRTETCDKETNTLNVRQQVAESSRKSQGSEGRNSGIRRSQTFSPACGPGAHYICKLNRSDSDSSMPLYKRGPFQRNSLQRRSLRWKRTPSSVGLRGGKVVTRTSLDMELDLQASQTRLLHLNDENSRLRELTKKIEEARARGETELPAWLSDDEHFQSLLSEADKMTWKLFQEHILERQREEMGQMTKQERRAEQLMKRVTRDVHRLKRNHPNALTTSFREKLAYITTVNMQVPVIPSDGGQSEDNKVQELLKDGRVGHEV